MFWHLDTQPARWWISKNSFKDIKKGIGVSRVSLLSCKETHQFLQGQMDLFIHIKYLQQTITLRQDFKTMNFEHHLKELRKNC
jgi:hypothetical protein